MFVHGDNLRQKETSHGKYSVPGSRKLLAEIRGKYDRWHKENEKLKGPSRTKDTADRGILQGRIKLLSDYKDFIDQQKYAEAFDSRSNLHSTVLEEFMYYLFRDLAATFSKQALIGKSQSFKDMFFLAPNYQSMLSEPNVRVERKTHDFVIGVKIEARLTPEGTSKTELQELEIPAVAIECKTYLDKTMLEGSSTAAEQLKAKNPNAIYIVVSEWLKLTESVNLTKFRVDQIYVLRKQKNTDREFRFLPDYSKNPIALDVVEHLYNLVREHLTTDWEGGLAYGLERGYLLH
jgi:hypothetical protein